MVDVARHKAKAAAGCMTSRGCALGNASVEIPEDNDRLNAIVSNYESRIRQRLRGFAADMGAHDANALGDSLMLLLGGAYCTRLTFPANSGPVAAIGRAARALMDAHVPLPMERRMRRARPTA